MTRTQALQDTLAAEHAAVFLLAAFGGALSAASSPVAHTLVTTRHRVHRGRREFLVTTLRGLGETPVAAAPAYALPDDLESETAATTAAGRAETLCTQEYATLVASTTGDLRDWAVTALADSALSTVAWGLAPDPFPGAPELSDP